VLQSVTYEVGDGHFTGFVADGSGGRKGPWQELRSDLATSSPQERDAFAAEMTGAGVDWQMHLYGGVGHSFTNRYIDAWNIPGFAYHAAADRRPWRAMRETYP